jgi:hypothetical protein
MIGEARTTPTVCMSARLMAMNQMGCGLCFLGERLGSGDGEGWTLLTRQIAFEPLPASVLLAFGWWFRLVMMELVWVSKDCERRLYQHSSLVEDH